ncbi:MAG: hypothetical protein HFH80_10570 [Lachnospiraceae bacterium]|nr:hypothetical protein [Lachnospiraceae bacterium]
MLNEERVILMTKMASYEEGEGKKSMSLGRYFRGDYISLQLLRAFFSSTIAYLLGLGLYVLYDFENFIADIYKMDLFVFAKNIIIWYAVFVVGYCVVTYAICAYRYARARKSLKLYYHNLKKLDSLYRQ